MTAASPRVVRAGQRLVPGDLVALYVIDLSPVGVNASYAFTPNTTSSRRVVRFRGVDFNPLDVACDGFAYSGQGPLPQPQVSISNVDRVLSSASVLYHDLIGAKLTRIRTYSQYLADGATPDDLASYADDVYFFEQKTSHTKKAITWKLAASMDQEGRKLPGRLILRDVCTFRYRAWNAAAGGYDYSHAMCPYAGGQAYDRFGRPTTPERDEPGRHVDDCCRVRFGTNVPLPFGGFPGVARTRQ